MVYGYGIWSKIERRLHIDSPLRGLRNMQKYNQVRQSYLKGFINKQDIFFFLRFSEGDQKLQDTLHQEGYNLFPNPVFSQFIRYREVYLTEVDQITKYPLKRLYLDKLTQTVVSDINKHFGDSPVVLKIGNFHASGGKYLLDEKRLIPHLKYKMRMQPITVEEFIPNARSIRTGFIGDPNNYDNYFITEHINSRTWLKNNAPEEENTYPYSERGKLGIPHIGELIEETKNMAIKYGANLLGVDWVVGEEKTGLLELNDMIGLPDGDYAFNLFYREVYNICTEKK